MRLRVSHSILRGVAQKQQHLDLKHRLRVRPCWLSDGLLSPDKEGVWVLLRTGLLGSSETGLFSFRYFSSLGQKARRGKQRWGTGREGGRSEASVIFTQLSGGLSLLEAGNNFKAVTSPCYFASRLVRCLHRQEGLSTSPS